MKKNRDNWENRIGEYQDRMLGNMKRIQDPNDVIEEAKSESEESSESNKLSSFANSSSGDYTISDMNQDENEEFDHNLNAEPVKPKLSISKQQSAAVVREKSQL